MADALGSLCFDKYGRPFVIFKDGERQDRLTGPEALRSHILAARSVADILKTSLGPKGLDKLLVTPEGEIVVTNDGATILELMDVDHEVAKLMVELARSQDKEVGDGTTGVVVLAGAFLERALELLGKGLHPTRIAEGFALAAKSACKHLDNISVGVSVDETDMSWLTRAAMTALGSKVANKCQRRLAELAVEAVRTTNDLGKDPPQLQVNSIVLKGKAGGQIEDTRLVPGVIVDQDFAHPQMKRAFVEAKVAVFSGTALQLPAVSTKHQINVDSTQGYNDIRAFIDDYCSQVVKFVLSAGAEVVVYSGKIEEDIVHLFLQNGISAVESVAEIEMVAASVGAHVVPRAEELTPAKLGRADRVSVLDFGTTAEKSVVFETVKLEESIKLVTIFVRGSNRVVVEEVKRSLQDALCVVRNLIMEKAIVYGGGAAEISCSLAVQQESLGIPDVLQLAYQAFAEGLDAIPLALAHNSGLYPLQVLTQLKANHKPFMGVDCMFTGHCDMRVQGVVEGLRAKKQQLVLATQVVMMILKIDDVRGPKDAITK